MRTSGSKRASLEVAISFTEEDLAQVTVPHHDPLVISADVTWKDTGVTLLS